MVDKSIKNKLEKFLDQYEETFTIDELCGFLYGIAITPEIIMPSEWLPVIFSDEMPEFESQSEAQEVMKLLMDAYNQFIGKFNDGTLEFPYDFELIKDDDDFALIEDWCLGLSLGIKMRPDLWMPNQDPEEIDEMHDEIISCIAIVGACADPENADRFFDHKYSTDSKVKKEGIEGNKLIAILFGNLPMAVESLTKIGAEIAVKHQNRAVLELPIQSKKTGRNEPCPCDSGKKFKKCCIGLDYGGAGRPTIH
jgi:uncharacterized protein